jgi:riboflavin synthase
MFTGLIEGTGSLIRMDRRGSDAQMVIQAHFHMEHIQLGESISVDGACLTLVSFSGDVFNVDVSVETLSRTTLGKKTPGSSLNLERALRLGDRLGGHLVTGHVDGIGTLLDRYQEGRSWRLMFRAPPGLAPYIIEKGSIAVNGVSLTVNGCCDDGFDVNIVPHTGEATTMGKWRKGDEVNIETDLMGKYVEKMLKAWRTYDESVSDKKHINVDFLQKHGFLD